MRLSFTEHWADTLAQLAPNRTDVYLTEEYVGLYAREDTTAECAIVDSGDEVWLLPYLRRPIAGSSFWDLQTAYGYGGPVSSTDDSAFTEAAFELFAEGSASRGCVAGFLRFHPLLRSDRFVSKRCTVVDDRETVLMDLRSAPDILLAEMHPKNRNMIRRAEREDWRVEVSDEFRGLEEFAALYRGRMVDLAAAEFYHFDDSYFARLSESMCGSGLLVSVWSDERMVAGTIGLYAGPHGHYHLAAGSRDAATGAGNLALWRLALELRERGMDWLHLGGGTTAEPDDSLLRFKQRFGGSALRFRTGRTVFDPAGYASVCGSWAEQHPEHAEHAKSYFLKYRYQP